MQPAFQRYMILGPQCGYRGYRRYQEGHSHQQEGCTSYKIYFLCLWVLWFYLQYTTKTSIVSFLKVVSKCWKCDFQESGRSDIQQFPGLSPCIPMLWLTVLPEPAAEHLHCYADSAAEICAVDISTWHFL